MYADQVCVRKRQKYKIIKHLGVHKVLLCRYCPETMSKTKPSQTLHILGHSAEQQDAN